MDIGSGSAYDDEFSLMTTLDKEIGTQLLAIS
jgi:hypothetical protein